MTKAYIAIAAHKPFACPHIPYHHVVVAGASAKNKNSYENGLTPDNTGENISDMNAQYNELTVLYWMWKNAVDCEYYGLVHYRRYFSFSADCSRSPRVSYPILEAVDYDKLGWRREQIEAVLSSGADAYAARREPDTLPGKSEILSIQPDDTMKALYGTLEAECPEFIPYADRYFHQKYKHMFNMFLMKKSLFTEYCSWLFDVLGEYEERLFILRGGEKMERSAGLMGEHLLNIFLMKKSDEKVVTESLQTVMFRNTDARPSFPAWSGAFLGTAFDRVFPYGSERRDRIKWTFYMKRNKEELRGQKNDFHP